MADSEIEIDPLLGEIDPGLVEPDIVNDNGDHIELSQPLSKSQRRPRTASRRRKASSPLENTVLKRVNSDPELDKSKSIPFTEIILSSFKDDQFIEGIRPVLCSMMAPVVCEAVSQAVNTAVNQLRTGVIDELLEANKTLQETATKQMKLIESQKSFIETQSQELDENKKTVTNLQSKVDSLALQCDRMALELNNIEHYSRRNSLRLTNFEREPNQSEPELVNAMVAFLNESVLPDDKKISASDVERCHPVGRTNVNGHRQVLLKFKHYSAKQKVFANKKKLKGNKNATFISEDLTRHNLELVKSLSAMRRENTIHSFWTFNGHVYAKSTEKATPNKIVKYSDLDEIA